MTRRHLATLSTLAAALSLVAALTHPLGAQQSRADVALRAAMERHTVRGDCKGAIEDYRKIEATYRDNRPVVAQALVHMAECYQVVGNAESTKVYERVVRDFADQKAEATLALARLGGAGAATGAKVDRALWTGSEGVGCGRVSPDGRLITYTDPRTGGLMVHDIAGNTDRPLTTPTAPTWSQYADCSAMSKDGKQIAFGWWDDRGAESRFELRLASWDATRALSPRPMFASSGATGTWVGYFDWSPDATWIAAMMWEGRIGDHRHKIGLINVADGSLKVLKSTTARPYKVFVSPDGRYLAYDAESPDDPIQHDVFVLNSSTGQDTRVVERAEGLIGWSPDGTQLLYSSNRFGPTGIFRLPFEEGKAQGPAELVRAGIGPSESLGLTASGTLYVEKHISTREMAIAAIDLDAGKLLGSPVPFTQGFRDDAGPQVWSPDGKKLIYRCGNDGICFRDVSTGQVSRLPLLAIRATEVRSLSPDGLSLVTRGTDLSGRPGIFRIDARTGAVMASTLIPNDSSGVQAHWRPDGNVNVYFFRVVGRDTLFIERDLASGTEREVNRVSGLAGSRPLSNDGQFFVVRRNDAESKTMSILLVPVAGGPPRELLRLTQPEELVGWGPTPDSRSVIFVKTAGSGRELWVAPVTGGPARKLDIDPDTLGSLSPDGTRISFYMGRRTNEVWALENFLPPTKRKN